MKKPAFLFYPGDWLRDTGVRQLSPREKGVYIELLIFLFDNGGYASLSMEDLMCTLNFRVEKTENVETSSVEVFGSVIERLLKCGVIHRTEDGRLYNRRILRDLETKDEVSQKRSEAGKLGNQKRWSENRKCDDLRSQNCRKSIANESQDSEICDEEKIANDRYSFSSSSSNINTPPNARARAQEEPPLPRNMPTDEQNAVDMCIGIGVPDDFIIQAYKDSYAVGFRDKGNAIINWPAYISAYWNRYSNAQKRKEQQKPKPKQEQKLQYPSDRIEVPTL